MRQMRVTGTMRRLMPDETFVAAVIGQRLARAATDIVGDPSKSDDHERAHAAAATCDTIAAQLSTVQDELVDQLTSLGHAVTASAIDGPRQHHTMSLRTADVDAAAAVRATLVDSGYEPWESWTGGALESFRRTASHFTVARTDTHTVVVRIEWRDAPRRSALQRAVTPTAGDWYVVDLPRPVWWAYSVVRPVRLIAERLGRRRRHDGSLGPYLVTPDSLIDPLFAFAGITADDVVADVGCGDGRLVVAAASRFGCRAIGVEHSADLVERSARVIAEAGVAKLVTIDCADARTADLSSATIILVFLPVDVAGELLDDLLAKLPPGGRLVVHEQRGLPASVMATSPPDESQMLLSGDAVTVAHRWNR